MHNSQQYCDYWYSTATMKHAAATTAAHAPGKSAQQQQNADHSVSTAPDSEAAAQPAHSSPQAEQASTSSAAGQSTGSPASSTAGNSSAPADTGGGGKRHLVHALAPAVVLATCAATSLWLALRLMHSRQRHGEHSASSRRSSNARNHQQHSRTQRQHAAAEPPEPASTLAVFASDFQLHTQDVALPARPAALEGLSCVVSEHIPIQVRAHGSGGGSWMMGVTCGWGESFKHVAHDGYPAPQPQSSTT